MTTLTANKAMENALSGAQIRQDEILSFMQDEKIRLRKSRTEAEKIRIAEVKSAKVKAQKSKTGYVDTAVGGKSVRVKKNKTVCDKMLKAGQLTKELRQAVDALAIMVADAMGAATQDQDDSTSRLCGPYESYIAGAGFQSRTPSDRQLDGMTAYKNARRTIPPEFRHVFDQIMAEEVGQLGKNKTLAELGEMFSYTHRQASAAGGMQVYMVASLIAHYLREKGIFFM